MTTIPTLTGERDPGQLGVTLMHEHIFIRTPELQEAFPGFMDWDSGAVMTLARDRLTALRQSGVDTIVDCTAPGLGRDIRLMAKAAEGTGLQVIACTGYYTFTTLPFPFQYHGPGRLFEDRNDEMLVSLFVRDIEEGIQGTGIRAGILKCCTDEPGVTPDVERVLRAVARAHNRTGVPITTHTHAPTRRGLDQQRIFQEEGVDPGRVVIGHSNETTDLDYLEQLISNGSYVGFDRCGLHLVVDLESQLDTLAELCRRGYADRVVFSHDRHCRSDWFTEAEVESVAPDWRYEYIPGSVLPALASRGVSAAQVEQMMVHNPRDIFSGGTQRTGAADRASAAVPGS